MEKGNKGLQAHYPIVSYWLLQTSTFYIGLAGWPDSIMSPTVLQPYCGI